MTEKVSQLLQGFSFGQQNPMEIGESNKYNDNELEIVLESTFARKK